LNGNRLPLYQEKGNDYKDPPERRAPEIHQQKARQKLLFSGM